MECREVTSVVKELPLVLRPGFPAGKVKGLGTPPATAYSLTGRRNHHYNLSETHKNQHLNVNIRRLKDEAPTIHLYRKRGSVDDGLNQSSLSPRKVQVTKSSRKRMNSVGEIDLRPDESDPAQPALRDFDPEKVVPDQPTASVDSPPHGTVREDIAETGCPLSNPDLPPVGEIDHTAKRCYCHLCTCGRHICPYAFMRARVRQGVLSSSYRQDYVKKDSSPSHKCSVEVPYVPNPQPIDLLTTSQRDFQPFVITKVPDFKPATASSSLKFGFRTSYQSEFPDWGPSQALEEKRPSFPYRGQAVKMDLRTTYAGTYKLPPVRDEGKDAFNKTTNTSMSTAFSYPLSVSTEFYGETTAQKEFRNYESRHMARLEPRPVEEPIQPESPRKIHFKTMYQSDFRGQQHRFHMSRRVNSIS